MIKTNWKIFQGGQTPLGRNWKPARAGNSDRASFELPTNIKTEEEAVEFVAGIAKEKHNKCWVVLSRREKVYITEDGEVGGKIITECGDKNYPYTRVK